MVKKDKEIEDLRKQSRFTSEEKRITKLRKDVKRSESKVE